MEQYHNLKLFDCGKQSICGFVENEKEKIVFKVSRRIDYVVEHEYKVMKRLQEQVSTFCPNFTNPVGLVEQKVEPQCKKDNIPFDIISKYPIFKKVLLEEYIEGNKLYKHIKNKHEPIGMIFNAIKQVMCAIAIAQIKTEFTHYDLHSDNVLLTPCDDNLVLLYKFNDQVAFVVPTNGYVAKIIDCGFSYIDTLSKDYLDSSLGHTDCGFLSDRHDPIADPKLFLISVKHELQNYKKGTQIFSNTVRNLFNSLSVDWDCGWDNYGGKSATDVLIHELEKKISFEDRSKIFSRYLTFAIDLMCNLVTLPLKENKHDDLVLSYKTFVKEFMKIEDEISTSAYNLYILKCMITSARECKELYLKDTEKGTLKFRRDVDHALASISKFCSPRKIQYERMLCSLYNFASCAEGRLYEILNKKMKKKYEEYEALPLSNIIDILQVLNVNLEPNYKYNEYTTVVLVDVEASENNEVKLDEGIIKKLNEAPHELHGTIMLEYMAGKKSESESESEDDIKSEKSEEDVKSEKSSCVESEENMEIEEAEEEDEKSDNEEDNDEDSDEDNEKSDEEIKHDEEAEDIEKGNMATYYQDF